MSQFILYTTSHCHLCEQAEALLLELEHPLDWLAVEIAADDTLMERYGKSIPVVKHCDNGSELNWPFNRLDLIEFISSNLHKNNHA
jgi:hypothetical protein